MKNYIFILLTALSVISCQPPEEVTTYYLIRHAEKDKSDATNRNPNLTEEGLQRAANWAEYFKDISLDEVYSTKYNRTMQTAKPTAESKGLEIKNYDPRTLYNLEFEKNTHGKTVLIVGHSNTTPVFANQIISKNDKNNSRDPYKNMDENDNSSLYVVKVIKKGINKSIETNIIKVDN